MRKNPEEMYSSVVLLDDPPVKTETMVGADPCAFAVFGSCITTELMRKEVIKKNVPSLRKYFCIDELLRIALFHYITFYALDLPVIAEASVTSSAYSMSAPIGRPRASLVVERLDDAS